MRKLLTLSFFSLFCGLTLIAQEKPGLIFSEFSRVPNNSLYFEITNMEDTAIDLREFMFQVFHGNTPIPEGRDRDNYRRQGKFGELLDSAQAHLDPGESFTILQVNESRVTDRNSFWFGRNITRPGFRDSADFAHYEVEFDWDTNLTRIEMGWEADSFQICDLLTQATGNPFNAIYLFWRDTVQVDALTNVLGANRRAIREIYPIAGIDNATANYLLVRKSTITKGNLDWHQSRGIDIADSEWLPIFYDYENPWNPSFFTTIGTHGDFSIDISSDVLTIDHDAMTITVPWGIRKGTFNVRLSPSRGLINEIDFGPGMAYLYQEQSDSASSACMLGDTLWVFAAGADLETAGYAIIPAAAKADDAMVLPRRIMFEDENSYVDDEYSIDVNALGSNRYAYQCKYYVSENGEGADSISWIPFATRVDSLFKYLEKAPDATWEIDWVDDQERVDLKEGDKLIVTNGSATEEYYLSLRPIVKSKNALLSAITWPDVEEDYWDSDTLPGFTPYTYQYNIKVPYGSSNIPALAYTKQDANAKVEMQSAKFINGSLEDRTTTITVTSADESIINEYKIIFLAEVRPTDMQPYFAEPIISEFVKIGWLNATFVEIANVGNQSLDLGKYMLVGPYGKENQTPLDVITFAPSIDSVSGWEKRYNKYIPGKKYSTYAYWADNHLGMVVDDPDILPILEPGQCFVIATFKDVKYTTKGDPWYIPPSMYDMFISTTTENQWGEIIPTHMGQTHYIFKIEGDSILEGKKAMTDPDDFQLIDVWGDMSTRAYSGEIGGVDYRADATYRRKPSSYSAATVPTISTGQTAEEHAWYQVYSGNLDPTVVGDPSKYLITDVGNYTHDEITSFMSTVSSIVYLVDDGFKTEDDLKIEGVISGTTSAAFIENLIPKDTAQDLSVISSSTGLVLEADDQLAAGDTLEVISADGKNTTKYTVELGALDNNATLVSDVYTIVIDGAESAVTEIPMDVTIEEVLENVEVPALAVLNVIDADGNLVPLQAMDMSDSTYRKTMLMGDVYFEVIAQDGTTITYLLDQGILSSDAWVTSNVYTVKQENLTINDVLEGTSVDGLLSNLTPAGNALMQVYDKAGYQRDSGYVALDDVVGVTSEDGSKTVTYSLRELGYVASAVAWVKSNVYDVNEDAKSVNDIPKNIAVSEFLSNVEVPGGAYLKLMDADDAEKSEGVILGTDKLEVTSEDLSTLVVYTLNLLVSVHDWALVNMKIYPNPVSDLLYVEGLEGSCMIELSSMNGQQLKTVRTSDPVCTLSLGSLNAGMYILRVSDSHQNVKVMQVVKSE